MLLNICIYYVNGKSTDKLEENKAVKVKKTLILPYKPMTLYNSINE